MLVISGLRCEDFRRISRTACYTNVPFHCWHCQWGSLVVGKDQHLEPYPLVRAQLERRQPTCAYGRPFCEVCAWLAATSPRFEQCPIQLHQIRLVVEKSRLIINVKWWKIILELTQKLDRRFRHSEREAKKGKNQECQQVAVHVRFQVKNNDCAHEWKLRSVWKRIFRSTKRHYEAMDEHKSSLFSFLWSAFRRRRGSPTTTKHLLRNVHT